MSCTLFMIIGVPAAIALWLIIARLFDLLTQRGHK